MVRQGELTAAHEIRRETLSVRARMTDILDLIQTGSPVTLDRVYRAGEGRGGIAVSVVAVLELAKAHAIEFAQDAPFSPIQLFAVSSEFDLNE
jgi:segregation and condensation protein A